MKDDYFYARNGISRLVYNSIFKRIFFVIDPETIHNRMVRTGQFLGTNMFTRKIISFLFSYSDKKLKQNILGIAFPNPIGLAAGFDKDAQLTEILPSLGFGFEEVGSITGEPCSGNPKPRVWRLIKSKSLVVYYGLKNEGCEKISKRLQNKIFQIPVGISIAKTNSEKTVDLNAGIDDYIKAYRKFTNIGSYFTINISCPNTFGGQPFTDSDKLELLLNKIDKIPAEKPIFLKISPDLSRKNIDEILRISEHHNIAGFICTNLTKNRKNRKIIDDIVPE